MKTHVVLSAAAAALVLLFITLTSLSWVPADHVGVSPSDGRIEILQPGVHVRAPFSGRPALYPLSLGPLSGSAPLRTADGGAYQVTFEIQARLDPARAAALHEAASGPGVEKVLSQGAAHGMAAAAASRPADDLVTGEIQEPARLEASRLLDQVGVTDVRLSIKLDSPESLLALARTLARAGRGALVKAAAEAALAGGGAAAWETHTAVGLARESDHDLRGAERAYLDALALQPAAVPPMAELVRIYTAVQEYDKLERLLLAALEADPGSASHLNWLAGAYMKRGSLEEAEKVFHRALEREPANTVILNNLGGVYLMRGRGEEAVEVFRRAVSAAPGDRQSRYNLGVALSALGRHLEGIEHLLEADRIDPENRAVLEAVAAAYRGLGRMAEAVRWERRAREAVAEARPTGG